MWSLYLFIHFEESVYCIPQWLFHFTSLPIVYQVSNFSSIFTNIHYLLFSKLFKKQYFRGIVDLQCCVRFWCTANIFFFIIIYYRILNIIPCATQEDLILYLFYIQQLVSVNPKLQIYPFPPSFPFGNHKFVFYVCESVLCSYYGKQHGGSLKSQIQSYHMTQQSHSWTYIWRKP